MPNIKYAIVGIVFGIVFVKAEILSWFRIQEMFHLQSFFMYGVMITALAIGMISVWLIKRYNIKTVSGEPITFEDKTFSKGQIYGGLMFGIGWAITGSCPTSLFVQIGSGFLPIILTFLSALAGTWVYGYFKEKLPH
jgi:uncharacterized membrane protein YedE/YeeE